MRAVSIVGLSLVAGVLGAPSMSSRAEDWKIPLGWDGKSVTLAELDASNANKSTMAKRDNLPGGVYMCKDINWGGSCQHIIDIPDGQCLSLGKNFDNKVSSFGPDPGLRCTIYNDWVCSTSNSYINSIYSPGISDLSQYGFNDQMSAFSCTYA